VPNLHDLKIQDGGGRHLGFRKNNSELDRAICTKFGGQMHHGHAKMTHDQNSKPEVYLPDVIKRMSGT